VVVALKRTYKTMRIKPTTINSLLVKFPIKPELSGSWSGMSRQGCPEYPNIYPESPGNCSLFVNCSEFGVSRHIAEVSGYPFANG
jgi:hypothetical protein